MAIDYALKRTGRFYDGGGGVYNIMNPRFAGGAKLDGVTDDDAPLSAAIAFFASEAPEGAELLVPGPLRFSTPKLVDSITNLKIKGWGGRYQMNFRRPPSQLIYTGTGTDDAFVVSSNFARNFQLVDIGLSYDNAGFTGSLLYIDAAPGARIRRAYIGGPGVDAASDLFTAESCVKINNGSDWLFDEVYMTEALVGLLGEGGELNHVVLVTCAFGDLVNAMIDADQVTGQGWKIGGCIFNPIRIAPVDGVVLSANGFEINGFQATGTNSAVSPSGDFFRLTGRGEIHGGNITTDYTGIRLKPGGVYKVGGGIRVRAAAPIVHEGGVLEMGAHELIVSGAGTAGIDVCPGGVQTTSIDIGPGRYEDEGAAAAYSVAIRQDNVAVRGRIFYDGNLDLTANGPLLAGENVQLQQAAPQSIAKTTNYTLTVKDSGQLFNNIGAAGSVTFTLPAAKRGLVYTIWKFANQTIVLTAPGSDRLINAAAASVVSLTNSSNELGAMIRVRCVTSTQWLVEELRGTWA